MGILKNRSCSWIGRLSIVLNYHCIDLQLQYNPIQNPSKSLGGGDVNKTIKNFIWKYRLRIAKVVLKENNKPAGFTLSFIKTYYKVVVINTELYWPKDKEIDQWNREPRNVWSPGLWQRWQFTNSEKRMIFLISGAGSLGYQYWKKINLDSSLTKKSTNGSEI